MLMMINIMMMMVFFYLDIFFIFLMIAVNSVVMKPSEMTTHVEKVFFFVTDEQLRS